MAPAFPEDGTQVPRLFPSMSSPSLSPDVPTLSRAHPDNSGAQNRVAYEKAKRKLLKSEKHTLKEELEKEKDKTAELEKELRNLRSQLFASPPAQDPESPAVLRRVKSSLEPKEESRSEANSDALRKAKSYRKTLSSTNLFVPLSPSSRPTVTSPPSNTYSHNFQLRKTRALSPNPLPTERKPKPPETPPPPEPVGSDVDDFLHEILERKQISGNIRKLEEGYFLIGTKRLAMQVLSGQLVVRVGGGFMNFEEWVRRFGRREGIIIGGDSNNNSTNSNTNNNINNNSANNNTNSTTNSNNNTNNINTNNNTNNNANNATNNTTNNNNLNNSNNTIANNNS
eukprot:Phypoly_transcript_10926.p1 GENE.Phypoly_transcript_10926~~Phypoly_transcript_10926.p1  ORF type:complete len:394 (+),score=91.45 Phypoly_transcript_10926:164-1183(+)